MPGPPSSVTTSNGPLWERARSAALDAGVVSIGVTTAEPLEPARTVIPLRKEQGLAGKMQFTYRNPDRSTDPRRALPGAESIIVAAWSYARSLPDHLIDTDRDETVSGRVAMYAWRDHYAGLAEALELVASVLRAEGHAAAVHLDNNHLVDRNVAYRAGLGWYGKNANLLLPEVGSWFVLGSVVTDAALEPTGSPMADGCGPCRRCMDDCPTGAIVAPGVVDARRCLAWIVQGPGEIPVEFRAAVGDRIYGCDDCQDVCPPNMSQPDAPAAESDSDPVIDLLWLLEADDASLMARVGRWYIAKRDPNVVRRTALVILGNSGLAHHRGVQAAIARYQQCGDVLLEEHADWAATQLGLSPRTT